MQQVLDLCELASGPSRGGRCNRRLEKIRLSAGGVPHLRKLRVLLAATVRHLLY
jgi:hypothetical protein